MNETGTNVSVDHKSICVTCLETTNDLYPMSYEYKTEYKKFVRKTDFKMVKNDAEMICRECCWLFRRFLKFKQQCRMARSLLKEAVHMKSNTDIYFKKLTYCFNLITTKADIHFISENTLCDIQSNGMSQYQSNNPLVNNLQANNSLVNNSLVNNLQVNVSLANNLQTNNSLVNNSLVNNLQVNDSLANNPLMNNPLMNGSRLKPIEDDRSDSTEFNNDDELPLVIVSRNKRKSKRKKKMVPETEEIKSQLNVQNVSSKKVKKELKDGFTSRMVQETDEYIVIKLNKEQVLKEMEDRSKSEAYIQSPFKCEKCIKGFNFQDVLRTHMEKHTEEIGTFQCDMCSQYCRSAVSLRGHLKSHTTRYKCKLCGVVRLSRQHLLEHHSITHTMQAVTYTCDTCQFNTNKRTVMQRHVKSHVKCEPHACEQCGKLFKSIDSLRVHTMRHDKSSRLRCTQCDVGFVYHSLLRRHMTRVHERRDYYCVECDAQFKSNESLRLHFKKAKKHRDSSSYKPSPARRAHACT